MFQLLISCGLLFLFSLANVNGNDVEADVKATVAPINVTSYAFFNDTCNSNSSLIFFDSIKVHLENPKGNNEAGLLMSASPSASCETETNSTIEISFTLKPENSSTTNVTHAKVTFHFSTNNTGPAWTLSIVINELEGSGSFPSTPFTLDTRTRGKFDQTSFIGAPLTYSYHCTYPDIWWHQINQTFGLQFRGIQVEAFAVNAGKFGQANDCASYFTIPILSGLLVTLLLISILSLGIYMISTIETMDRFSKNTDKPLVINTKDTD